MPNKAIDLGPAFFIILKNMKDTVDASQNSTEGAQPSEPTLEQDSQEILKLEEQLLRVRADLENVRRRHERERQDWIRAANARLLEELLPVADALKMGLDAAPKTPDVKNLVSGFEAVKTQLGVFFQGQGVEVLDPLGAPFDAQQHECVAHAFDANIPEDCVSAVVRVGYSLNGRLLRAACVIVSKGPEAKTL